MVNTTNAPAPDTTMASNPVEQDITEIVAALQRLPAREIERVKEAVLKLGEATAEKTECCPRCGGKAIVRNGHKCGKQAYLCKGCGKSFVSTTTTVMYMSHQGTSAWITVLADTLDGVSLAKTAEKLGIKSRTVFYMRHKILIAIEQMLDALAMTDEEALAPAPEKVVFLEQDSSDPSVEEKYQESIPVAQQKGVYELDETYIPDSFKGTRHLSDLVDRSPRKRGGTAKKPGLSKEQVCICTAVGRNGATYAKSVNRSKPTNDQLQEALAEHLPPDSLALTDGATGYAALCARRRCSMKNVKQVPPEETSVFNLNTANSFHDMIKQRIKGYRGVATKYLNRYNALFSLVYRRRWMTFDELCQRLLTVNCTSFYNSYDDVESDGLLTI